GIGRCKDRERTGPLQRVDQSRGLHGGDKGGVILRVHRVLDDVLRGIHGAPPTVTVCSFICACVEVAAPAAKTTAATAIAVGRIEGLMSLSPCACARRASGLRIKVRST